MNEPDENGLYHRTVLQDGRFGWKHHKYKLGSIHANEKISIQVSGDELIIRDKGGNLVENLKIWHPGQAIVIRDRSIVEDNTDPDIPVSIQDVEDTDATTQVVEQPSGHFTACYGPDKDGLYTRRVESSGKFWWGNAKYYLSKKVKGKNIRLRVVENTLHVLDEAMTPLRILQIRSKRPNGV
jgi:hypothetical protein